MKAVSSDTQIDINVYLAGLVSNQAAIDKLLDPMRMVTAGRLSGRAYTESDQKILGNVRRHLERYLLKKEPLLALTPESLAQRVHERFTAYLLIRRLRLAVAAISVLAVALGVLVFLWPDIASQNKLLLASTAILMALYTGALGILLAAMGKFSPTMRRAYRTLAVGVALGCLLITSQTVASSFSNGQIPWNTVWPMLLVYPPAYWLTYWGIRELAALQNIRGAAFDPRFVLLIGAVGSAICLVIPHITTSYAEPVIRLFFITTWMKIVFVGAGSVLLYHLSKVLTELYGRAIRILYWALVLAVFGWIVTFSSFVYENESTSQLVTAAFAISFIVSTILFLRSAYLLNKVSRY